MLCCVNSWEVGAKRVVKPWCCLFVSAEVVEVVVLL
jgi:hypothetical protein